MSGVVTESGDTSGAVTRDCDQEQVLISCQHKKIFQSDPSVVREE